MTTQSDCLTCAREIRDRIVREGLVPAALLLEPEHKQFSRISEYLLRGLRRSGGTAAPLATQRAAILASNWLRTAARMVRARG